MIYIPRNFILQEFVCPHIFNKYGKQAWSFIDDRLLQTMDLLRDKIGKPIYINNWDSGGKYDERGYRCIQCSIVLQAVNACILYASAHTRAQACDFEVKGMSAIKAREWLIGNPSILPYPIRLEKNAPTWNHLDICNTGKNKIELFIGNI
jgi:hypothetical protein